MAGNSDPIFSKAGSVQWSTGGTAINAAANDLTGVSTNNQIVFGSSTNGAYISHLRWKHAGTNVAAVARIYVCQTTATTVAGNNVLITEQALPAITASTAAPQNDVVTPLGFPLNAGYQISVGLGSSVANGWWCSAFGGQY